MFKRHQKFWIGYVVGSFFGVMVVWGFVRGLAK